MFDFRCRLGSARRRKSDPDVPSVIARLRAASRLLGERKPQYPKWGISVHTSARSRDPPNGRFSTLAAVRLPATDYHTTELPKTDCRLSLRESMCFCEAKADTTQARSTKLPTWQVARSSG